ncbi:MAG: Sensors of blue-light using FAD [uncultured Sphingosinicella sp.]|uniref:Sensors of blue-light using FAD n=1 Tax=uncultured Sphingosinicella sp. TaxID=478748 RepID=A0A6J4TW31_9SPHN|nr:BLUF domain-containing protein [uncultured Sphingosinicella sp.]CAA9533788.1 MAG: Sensors of blue-light using FAD [uncultured Sphingosinicella sp.]
MEISLLYVSRSTLRLPDEAGAVDAIVAASQSRNPQTGVTGALVFTEKQFAQYLEGPEESVRAVMDSIRCDPRHSDIQMIFDKPLHGRRFPTWAMAYAGPSTFVAGHVLTLAEAATPSRQSKAAERLISLMRQFVEAQLIEQRRKDSGAA